jgi:hypothetical protein
MYTTLCQEKPHLAGPLPLSRTIWFDCGDSEPCRAATHASWNSWVSDTDSSAIVVVVVVRGWQRLGNAAKSDRGDTNHTMQTTNGNHSGGLCREAHFQLIRSAPGLFWALLSIVLSIGRCLERRVVFVASGTVKTSGVCVDGNLPPITWSEIIGESGTHYFLELKTTPRINKPTVVFLEPICKRECYRQLFSLLRRARK